MCVISIKNSILEYLLRGMPAIFIFSCVFDPADRLLGLKAWLFSLCFFVVLCRLIQPSFQLSKERRYPPKTLFIYLLFFIAVPTLSIVNLMLSGEDMHYSFQLIKAYIMILLVLPLIMAKVDLMPQLSVIVMMLAVAIVGTYAIIWFAPELFYQLKGFGEESGIFILDSRRYGPNTLISQVYFVTSPMLVIPISYYFNKACQPASKSKVFIWAVVVVGLIALYLSGTRANVLVAIILPLALLMLHTKKKKTAFVSVVVFLILVTIFFFPLLSDFLNPAEYANNKKIDYFADYIRILSNKKNLLLGRGLGFGDYFDAGGGILYITELTYFELIRNFGLVGASIIFVQLVWPIFVIFRKPEFYDNRSVAIGYGVYLIMCVVNPNMFSSSGMLLLIALLVKIYSLVAPYNTQSSTAERTSLS